MSGHSTVLIVLVTADGNIASAGRSREDATALARVVWMRQWGEAAEEADTARELALWLDGLVEGRIEVSAPVELDADMLAVLPAVLATWDEDARCRTCGCTYHHPCPEGCGWVEADLCTACVGAGEAA